jgi:hypothetical protein
MGLLPRWRGAASWLAAAATAYSGRARVCGRAEVELAGRNARWVVGCCSRGVVASFVSSLRPYEEAGGQTGGDVESLLFPFRFPFCHFRLPYFFLFIYKPTKCVTALFCVYFYFLRAKLNTLLAFQIYPKINALLSIVHLVLIFFLPSLF